MNLLYEVEISSIEARSDRLENKVSTDTKDNALKLQDALMLNLQDEAFKIISVCNYEVALQFLQFFL